MEQNIPSKNRIWKIIVIEQSPLTTLLIRINAAFTPKARLFHLRLSGKHSSKEPGPSRKTFACFHQDNFRFVHSFFCPIHQNQGVL